MSKKEMDGTHEVPPYFICPISLEIMKDPVTLSTGVSYDRDSIELWLSAYGRNTCPVTKQPLADSSLTPNSTLLRLIHSWIATTSGTSDAENPAFDVSDVLRELTDVGLQIKSLKRIRAMVQLADPAHRDYMEKAGVTSLIAALISIPESHDHISVSNLEAIDEATSLLHLLNPSPETLKQETERSNGGLISTLCTVLQRGAHRSRSHAALLLNNIFKAVDKRFKNALPLDLFDGIVEILKDQNSSRATTIAALSVLVEVAPHGRNVAKAVEAGAVAVLVELLVEERAGEGRLCEAMLWAVEVMCGQAEGRSALVAHPAGVAAVAGKLLRVSHVATARAVKALLLVCRHCRGGGVVEEMMEVGAVAKVCMVVQVEGSRKTKEKAKEIMGLHLNAWSKFPCFPLNCFT